jgi:translation initiation factor 2D
MISDHLIPYLPEQYTQYTFKKTSWKKAATFLKKYMDKEGIIKTKDRGGETVILSINWNHKLIMEFRPYSRSRKPVEHTESKDLGNSSSFPQMVEVRELYKPTGKVLRSIIESQSHSYGKGNMGTNG